MKLWRCRICGDPYLGEEKPRNCPFCGAHERYIVEQEGYVDATGAVEPLSQVSRRNLQETLKLEIDNTQFYACAARNSGTDEARNLFKALSKIESEHATIVCKALGIEKPVIEEVDICTGDYQENLRESHRREERAIKAYGRYLSEATEPRVQEVFSALIAIESDHLALSEERMR